MLTKLELITIIQNSIGTHTAYFFQKTDKIVLPITLKYKQAKQLITKNPLSKATPDIHDTIRRLTNALGGSISSITIYRAEQEVFYTYLNICKDTLCYEINCAHTDALAIAIKLDLPVYVEKALLIKKGIKVSTKLLKEALSGDYKLY